MSFKLSILLLSLILATNSVPGDEYEAMDTDLTDEYVKIDMGLTAIEDLDDDLIKDFVSIQLDPKDQYEALYPERRATNAMVASTHSSSCSCEPDPIEAEILRDSYNYCRSWNNKYPNQKVARGDFRLFMGKNKSDNYRIQQYYVDHPSIPQGPFDLDGDGYGKLFKYICKSRGVSVEHWAENRKNRAEKESREQTSLFFWQENN
ncbi:uncharacterized protein LOC126846129 [Adelges cooleyi]|uniref:uncharacterized protein LOC126846129 n=1 Tax=Adelges cooleyi TaxID=133065 RepID=UPI0021807C1F|nr:uncharacterized protein LOC126846129 [Adelges cooleyi]